MKTIAKSILLAAGIATGAGAGLAEGLQLKLDPGTLQKMQPRIKDVDRVINPGIIRVGCVDLAVFATQAAVGDRVRITYGVRNVSRHDYVSGRNQQSIAFSKDGRRIANKAFINLAAGRSLSWSATVARLFEFPSTYKVAYNPAPDITTDANEANDDCRRSNNLRSLQVSFR